MPRTRFPSATETARERTALAWNRSGLATVACIAVLLRHLWPLHGVSEEVALALVSLAAIVWAVALFLLSASRRGKPAMVLSQRGGLLLCIGTVLLAVVGFGLAFLPAS
jgi:uncharacterized membrane protein YidH (DUF202 family)